MNTNKITFKDLTILHVVNPRLKHSYISVSKEGAIKLKTPKVSRGYIEELLNEKSNWIEKKLIEIELNPPKKVNIEDEVLLFGDIYSIDSDEALELRTSLHRLRKPNEKNILRCYDNYYKLYANDYLTPRIQEFSKIMNLKYSGIIYKKMRARWGSCSSTRVITLNTQLLKLRKEQIDYVIVHELAHLTHMNHSKNFHSLVQTYIPNALQIRKDIKQTAVI